MNSKWFFAAAIFLLLNNYSAAQQKPNIIYIMTDDLGYADLSCYGRKDYQTPNLDKLASEGMKFTNAYAAAPVCTPTRTAFMTGRYPARTTIGLLEPWTPVKRDSAIGLNASDYSVAALVKRAGYKTALIGKWHLGIGPSFSPLTMGLIISLAYRPVRLIIFHIQVMVADMISMKTGNLFTPKDIPLICLAQKQFHF